MPAFGIHSVKSLGVLVSATSYDVIGASDVIIIAVKPYQVLEVMDNLLKVLKTAQVAGSTPKSLRPLIVSVASSVPLAELEKRVSSRSMQVCRSD